METQNPARQQVGPNQNIQNPEQKKGYKSFWPIIGIAVLSAIVGGLLMYVMYSQGLDEQVSSLLPGSQRLQRENAERLHNQVVAETGDWEIYRNEEYGFEFKYPSNMEFKENVFSGSSGFQVWFSSETKPNESFQIKHIKNNFGVNSRLEDYFYLDFNHTKETILDGQKALVYEVPDGYCDAGSCGLPFVAMATKKGNDLYAFEFQGDAQLDSKEKSIIDSFHFVRE